ncbi:hypothetical protein [Phytohabitans rumicis]|uniref:Transglycosylase SLT domain-containing protein n=1 Tax=Phytohabitans rumicis TaxID=1076125 RepID=A0A6V8L5E6_9ACTN|nr:hypothetical protein [Phytohabitans rumicis]GFJ92482.1 hypothetical protein Prum_061240 [Phytohabitans rumicis]
MARRTPAEVYRALLGAGFPPQAAVTMTAIAGGESGWDDAAVGDTRLQNATWGPSYGVFQVRTLKSETGKGTARDIMELTGDLGAQARAAWEISQHGADFTPWTVYTSGRYKDFLGQVSGAVGVVGDVIGDLVDKIPGADITVGDVLGGARGVAVEVVAVVFGLALVVAGLAKSSGLIRRRADEVEALP